MSSCQSFLLPPGFLSPVRTSINLKYRKCYKNLSHTWTLYYHLFLEGQSFFNPMLHFNFLVTISFSRRIDSYFQCMTVAIAHNRVSNLFLPRWYLKTRPENKFVNVWYLFWFLQKFVYKKTLGNLLNTSARNTKKGLRELRIVRRSLWHSYFKTLWIINVCSKTHSPYCRYEKYKDGYFLFTLGRCCYGSVFHSVA